MLDKKYSRAYVEITNTCNRNCSFCPGTKRAPKRMTLDEFKIVCDSLLGITEYIYLHVLGEPLTHPDLIQFIEHATSRGFKCAVTTNGTLLDSRGEGLINSGIYKVNISVHSFEDGDDEKYYSYLKSISSFADSASSVGILTVLRLWNKGTDGGRNDRTLEFFKSEFPTEWKWNTRGARIQSRLHLEWGERFDWPDINLPEGTSSVFCHGLGDHFGILSDGSVIPCCLDKEGDITLGNLFSEPLCDILSSERAMKIRDGFMRRCVTEELCKRCGYARRF